MIKLALCLIRPRRLNFNWVPNGTEWFCFISGEKSSRFHCTKGWVRPRIGLDTVMENIQIPVCLAAHNQSLYRLSCAEALVLNPLPGQHGGVTRHWRPVRLGRQRAANSFLRLITLATYLRLVLGSNQPMTYYTQASISGRKGILTTNKSSVRNAVRLLTARKAQTCHPLPRISAPDLN